jgi:signal peptidase I
LLSPGAGHFLLGAFRRGAAWAVGVAGLAFVILFAAPISVWRLSILISAGVTVLGRVATAIDSVRIVTQRPAWKSVIAAWAALLVAGIAVAEPLTRYYRTHYAQAFTIPSPAMQPTLLVGDYIIVDKSAYHARAPERGDIVVFAYPKDERRDFIKRIIGTPGDLVHVKDDQVLINGQPLIEPYISSARSQLSGGQRYCAYAYGCEPTRVPPDSYVVMGDNRYNSQDSRYWGFVRREKIKGRAVMVYWSWDTRRHWLRSDRLGRAL